MCLHTLQQKPKVAEEDIIIFKKLEETDDKNIFLSPCQGFAYRLGEIYETDMCVLNGLETPYATEKEQEWVNNLSDEEMKTLKSVIEGFHAYTTDEIEGYRNTVKIKGVIPKGSLYYENHLGLIVSNSIKLIEVVNQLENESE